MTPAGMGVLVWLCLVLTTVVSVQTASLGRTARQVNWRDKPVIASSTTFNKQMLFKLQSFYLLNNPCWLVQQSCQLFCFCRSKKKKWNYGSTLKTRKVLLLYKVSGDSTLLVLNRKSWNSYSAFLALNWWYKKVKNNYQKSKQPDDSMNFPTKDGAF